jgi:hypothetical protein
MKASILLNAGLLTLLVCLAPPTAQAQVDFALIDPAAPPGKWPPTVSLVSPVDNSVFLAPANLTLIAHAQDLDGYLTIKTVEFFAGAHSLGVTTNNPVLNPIGPFVLYWKNVPAGHYSLTAKALDAGGLSAVSKPVAIFVAGSVTPPVVRIETRELFATEMAPYLPNFNAAVFALSRKGPVDKPLTVAYAVSGTASNNVDYVELPGVATFEAGSSNATILVVPMDDRLVEGTETVEVRLLELSTPGSSQPGPYVVEGLASAQAYILDDDSPAPVLTLTAVDPFASEKLPVMSSIDPAVFQVTRTGDLGYPQEVSYAISGTASNGLDYRALSGRLSLPAGTISAQILVNPLYDTLAEGSETVTLELLPVPDGSPRFFTLGEPHAAKASITDFDAGTNLPTTVNVFATDPDAEESGFRELSYIGRFTLARTGRRDIDLPVYFTLGGTAINGVDYKFVTNRVVIAAGSAETNIIILPRTDNLVEEKETVVLTIEPIACIDIYPPPPECYRIGPSDQATVYIKDYRTTNLPPTITLTTPANGAVFRAPATIQLEALTRDPDGYASSAEFYANGQKIGHSFIEFFVAPKPGTPIQIPFAWTNVPAGIYSLTARTVDNQGASAVSAPVQITVLGTNQPPKIVVTSPTNGAVFQAPATIPLEALTRDPDGYANAAQFYANDHLIGEGRIIFIRAPDPGDEIRIPFAWTNVPAGIYSLTACTSDSGGVSAVSPPVKITVLDARSKPVVIITATDCVARERAGRLNPAKFKVHRTGPTNESLTVFYSLSGTAENGKDYERLPGSATIPPGARKAIITVNPVDDAIAEFPETVVLGLKPAPEGQPAYELGVPRLAAAVILDNEVLATTVLPGRLVHVTVPVPGPGAFRLEASANLVDWVVVQPNAAVENGAVNFVDPEAPSQPCRFYRVVPVEASAIPLEDLADDE